MTSNVETAVKCEEDLFCGVNTVKDCEHMTDLEKKHQPIITAPKSVKKGQCFEVAVEIGKLMEHPNERGHYIEFVELYADHTYLSRIDLTSIPPPALGCTRLFSLARSSTFCKSIAITETPV